MANSALPEDWTILSEVRRAQVLQQLPREQADELFLHLSSREQLCLLLNFPEAQWRGWLRLLPPDDITDLLQLAPDWQRERLASALDDVTRREVNALLAYKEDRAGGLMNPRFARLRSDITIDEAVSYMRYQAAYVETIYYAYVLDDQQHLLGVVGFRDLFTADRSKLVSDIMRQSFFSVPEQTDQEEVSRVFSESRLPAIPVLDANGRMQGIITADDIVDVVEQEASEDIQKVGGTSALAGPYFQISFGQMLKKRAGWLTILFVGEMLTATAMAYFEQEIARAVVLALFIPLIISSGGNSGSQATTLVIRSMALGEVRLRDWWRVIRRETSVGFFLGSILAAIGIARILIWQAIWKRYGTHYMALAVTIAFSLVGVVVFGTVTGSMLPFALRRIGLDPASASAPLVATLVDVTGLVVYFTIAGILLKGTLL